MEAAGVDWLADSPVRSLRVGGTLRYLCVSIIGRGDVRKYPSRRVPTRETGLEFGLF
jgi:hypothetical protein